MGVRQFCLYIVLPFVNLFFCAILDVCIAFSMTCAIMEGTMNQIDRLNELQKQKEQILRQR